MMTPAVLAALALLASNQEPAEKLQKRLEDCSRHISERFVFFGGGSGVLISETGYCLTNHHVAGTQQQTRVTLYTGEQIYAKLVCTDATGDLSLFKLQGGETEKFPYVELGDSDRLEVGQFVMACGNPFGITLPAEDRKMYPTITFGIVSALHRNQGTYFDCIQTDAAVNPGNSGGPLVTLDGRLVGINGRIATRYMNRVNSGVGYAIPSNQIKNFLPEMMKGGEGGKIQHGMVGGLVLADQNTSGRGAQVQQVKPDSAADKSGLHKGDMVTGINGYPVFNRERFLGVVGTYPMGTEVELHVQRGAEAVNMKVKLEKYNAMAGLAFGAPPRAAPNRPRGSGYLGATVEDENGATQVVYVAPGSPADEADLRVGDVLLRINGRKLADREEFMVRLWQHRPGEKVRLLVRRDGKELGLEVVLGKHPDD
jgi:serine protease Do